MATFPGSFPGSQPPAASNPANFPGVDPAASNPAYFPAAQSTTGPQPTFPGARPASSPFQASFPAQQDALVSSQATFPGALASNPPTFPPAQTSLSANFAGTLPAAQPPNALPGAEPNAQDPAKDAPSFIRNPALLGPPPLVQIYPPIIKPTLDLYIEETHYIVTFTQRPLEVGGLFGTALLPLNKPAILRGEPALMAGSPQTSTLDVSPMLVPWGWYLHVLDPAGNLRCAEARTTCFEAKAGAVPEQK